MELFTTYEQGTVSVVSLMILFATITALTFLTLKYLRIKTNTQSAKRVCTSIISEDTQ